MVSYLEIIVDGYNFLKTTGLMSTQVSDLELEKGRKRLIQLLAETFPEQQERQKITIVFDSQTLLDLPTTLQVRDINVRFSKGYDSADELIMELIRVSPVPKRMLVVSSDHEIQTCAKRRKAQFIDSDLWLDELEKLASADRRGKQESDAEMAKKEIADSEYWMDVFADAETEFQKSDDTSFTPDTIADGDSGSTNKDSTGSSIDEEELLEKEDLSELDDPFPPGYGEDLLD